MMHEFHYCFKWYAFFYSSKYTKVSGHHAKSQITTHSKKPKPTGKVFKRRCRCTSKYRLSIQCLFYRVPSFISLYKFFLATIIPFHSDTYINRFDARDITIEIPPSFHVGRQCVN